MSVRRRQITYYSLRAGALCMFIVALVVPRGTGAALLAITAGVIAVLSGIGANAGGPGEQAGARRQMDHYEQVRAPQGDWPPFDPDRDIEGEISPP